MRVMMSSRRNPLRPLQAQRKEEAANHERDACERAAYPVHFGPSLDVFLHVRTSGVGRAISGSDGGVFARIRQQPERERQADGDEAGDGQREAVLCHAVVVETEAQRSHGERVDDAA